MSAVARSMPTEPLQAAFASVSNGARAQGGAEAPVLATAPSAERLNADDLRDLMRSVNETTQRLQQTHASLQSEVVRLQRELAEANAALRRSHALAALGEMAAGIAHEVRNPLGSIQLYAQMLAEDLASNPSQAELCRKIDRAVVGLDAIVRDVLSFARNMAIKPEPTTSAELIERAAESCQTLLARDIEVHRKIPRPAHRLRADVGLITQALANVIRNAVEAMGEGPCDRRQLHLTAGRRDVRCPDGAIAARIVLGVMDSGPGIPPEVLGRVFNPFFTTRAAGTGLGLAIVHRIVDAHGGHIHIENVQAGGTKVEICLPATPLPPIAAEHASHSEHGA